LQISFALLKEKLEGNFIDFITIKPVVAPLQSKLWSDLEIKCRYDSA